MVNGIIYFNAECCEAQLGAYHASLERLSCSKF